MRDAAQEPKVGPDLDRQIAHCLGWEIHAGGWFRASESGLYFMARLDWSPSMCLYDALDLADTLGESLVVVMDPGSRQWSAHFGEYPSIRGNSLSEAVSRAAYAALLCRQRVPA